MLKYEAYHFGENNLFSSFHNYNFNYTKNLHISFEFVYVKEGNIEICINTRSFTLKKNQCALILPYESHSFSTKDYSDSYICVFSPEYISTFNNMAYGKFLENPVFELSNISQNLVINNIFNPNNNILQIKSILYLICYELLEQTTLLEATKTDYELLHKILNYIQENFTKDISLNHVANKFGYSYTYISKYLNSILGISFNDFINENRISYAIHLLKNTDLSITDISFSCGYSSIRSFNRNFLKIVNTTPKNYKNNLINKNIT